MLPPIKMATGMRMRKIAARLNRELSTTLGVRAHTHKNTHIALKEKETLSLWLGNEPVTLIRIYRNL